MVLLLGYLFRFRLQLIVLLYFATPVRRTFCTAYTTNALPTNSSTYTNPIINSNHPDPGVLALPDGSGYAVVTTSNYATNGVDPAFPILFSSDLVNWDLTTYVFTKNGWPSWCKDDMWAPEMHHVNSTFYVYFSCRIADRLYHYSIGVAISTSGSPFGPYKDYGESIIDEPFGAIDVTYFKDNRSGGNYLLWKKNPSIYSSIYIRQVESDGITAHSEWPAIKLIQSTIYPDLGTTEAPWLIFRQMLLDPEIY